MCCVCVLFFSCIFGIPYARDDRQPANVLCLFKAAFVRQWPSSEVFYVCVNPTYIFQWPVYAHIGEQDIWVSAGLCLMCYGNINNDRFICLAPFSCRVVRAPWAHITTHILCDEHRVTVCPDMYECGFTAYSVFLFDIFLACLAISAKCVHTSTKYTYRMMMHMCVIHTHSPSRQTI